MFVGTMVSGNTDPLNYADNDGTCDHIWLTMLSGNAPQGSYSIFNETKLRILLSGQSINSIPNIWTLSDKHSDTVAYY